MKIDSHDHDSLNRYMFFARAAGLLAVISGIAVLIGWPLNLGILKSLIAGGATMKPNTALCFILAGLSLWLSASATEGRGGANWIYRRGASTAATLVGLIALITITEYVTTIDLRIDSLFFHNQVMAEGSEFPGRMAEATALAFALLSLALLLRGWSARWAIATFDIAALGTFALGLVALLGYTYGVQALYNFYLYSSMALPTSVLLLVMAAGVLWSRPDRGAISIITSRHLGGLMARLMLPLAISVPLVVGWFRLKGEQAGLYETAFGLAMFAASNIFIFAALIWFSARTVNRLDTERFNASELLRESEERLRLLIDSVTDYAIFMLDPMGRVATWNAGAQRLKGYHAAEIIGQPFSRFYPEEDLADGKAERILSTANTAGRVYDEGWRVRKDGTRFWANVTLSAIYDDHGQLLGFAKITRDLTERRAAEQALVESEERFRLMANSAPVMLWISGTDKLCTFFNKTWLDFTGRTMDQELGNGWAEGVHPEDHERCWQIYAGSFDRRQPFSMEYRLRRRDGEYRWLSDDGIPRFDAAGNFSGFIGSCVDITDRKRASEDRLRLLNVLESSLNEIYIFDSSSLRFDYVNRGAQRNLGYSLAELQQLTPLDLKPEHTELSFRKLVEPLLKQGNEKLIFHTIHRRKDGTDYPVEVHLQLVEQGERRVFLAVILDTSERLQAERAIRESQQRLEGLVESAMDGIITVDSEQRIVLFNPAAEVMFGLSATEAMGGSLERLLPLEARAEHAEHIRRFAATGVSSRRMGALGRIKGRRADGHEFPMEASISQIKVEGDSFFTVILRDITERDQAEKALQQAYESLEQKVIERTSELAAAKERAESADNNKTAFLATMSHELRTPLNAVMGFTGMMLMRLPGPLNEPQAEHLELVKSNAAHLLSLINDLLDLAKIEAGRLVLNKQPVVCQEVIEEVAATLRPQADNKKLDFRVTLPEEDCTLNTDRRLLSQILINLANNAIKFTEQGEVHLALSNGSTNGGGVCIQVADTGIGIRQEDHEKLFHAFEQIEHEHYFEGTGLGLHLSQKLAAEINGRIEVESEPGKGSTFRLLIPKE